MIGLFLQLPVVVDGESVRMCFKQSRVEQQSADPFAKYLYVPPLLTVSLQKSESSTKAHPAPF